MRQYRMRARQDSVDETKLRITEATMRLHERLGPAATTISAIADEAGVTRVTVYRHFPDETALVQACSAHWRDLHPRPDPETWSAIADPRERLRIALRQMYAWFPTATPMLSMIERDLDAMPAFVSDNLAQDLERRIGTLVAPFHVRGRARRRVAAAVSHALRLATWRSLCEDGGLSDDEAIELMVAAVSRAAR
jgi:AcrR family transcriptional regulator